MKLYFWLSKIPFLRNSYSNKFLFVAFLGIHIPLIGLIFTLVFAEEQYSQWTIIWFTLALTLVATLATLIVIHKLIKPISLASKTLIDYRKNHAIPNLPMHFTDESGLLMSNIQHTINENELYLKQKQDLINLLTHDIKDYASQPIGLAHLILDENIENTSITVYAQLIINSASKQLDFLEGFIKLLKEENEIATAELTKNNISMIEVISTVQEELANKLNDKKIALLVESEVDEIILHNKQMLVVRIISNLINNAIKFSHQDSTIALNVLQNNGYLQIKIKDNGIGFDTSQKQLLFEKFNSMSRLGTNHEASTGIGLYLCNEMVKKFKGSMDAFSEGENKGSVFIVSLLIFQE